MLSSQLLKHKYGKEHQILSLITTIIKRNYELNSLSSSLTSSSSFSLSSHDFINCESKWFLNDSSLMHFRCIMMNWTFVR